jgi:hypothetical protein
MKFFILIGKLLLSALMGVILVRAWQQNFSLGMIAGLAGTVASVYWFELSMKRYLDEARWIAIIMASIFGCLSLDSIHHDTNVGMLLFVLGGVVFWMCRVFYYCDEIGAAYQRQKALKHSG